MKQDVRVVTLMLKAHLMSFEQSLNSNFPTKEQI